MIDARRLLVEVDGVLRAAWRAFMLQTCLQRWEECFAKCDTCEQGAECRIDSRDVRREGLGVDSRGCGCSTVANTVGRAVVPPTVSASE
jgi:hypothetical protein